MRVLVVLVKRLGYAPGVSTARRPKAPEPAPDELTTINAFKMSRATLGKLDAWLAEQNQGRRGPKLSRNDLMRGVLDWAADERPDWESRR